MSSGFEGVAGDEEARRVRCRYVKGGRRMVRGVDRGLMEGCGGWVVERLEDIDVWTVVGRKDVSRIEGRCVGGDDDDDDDWMLGKLAVWLTGHPRHPSVLMIGLTTEPLR